MRERKKKMRAPRKVFLVICEGETEREYVEGLKRFYRLPITIKTKVSGNNINPRLIRQYLQELGLSKDDGYAVFYIYDADVECIVQKLEAMDGTVILTNPCFELWYLLHVKTHNSSLSSDGIVKTLVSCHPVWKSYIKGGLNNEQMKFLIENQEDACNRAKTLTPGQNPSSNMYEFISSLENEKKG